MPSVTRKAQAGRAERREQIERRLLDATERLMRDGASFTEISVDRLASAAGMSRASFYIYFEDKGDLLRRLAGEVFGELTAGAERWWSVSWRHSPDDARIAIAEIIASYRRHQSVLVALSEMAGYDPSVASIYRELLDDVSARLTRVIEDGQADGSIRRQLPAATTASALTWLVERACQQSLPAHPPAYDAELADSLTGIIWGALYLKPTTD
ncbi:MAG TPA: TetR/AcrR family transcriptional regulator [Mycobacterium sp.]|nr:TetR/AcrR family transcriptional regulator [Mycobacterium sp.]